MILRNIKYQLIEYMHRELYDRYYVHPLLIKSGTNLLPSWLAKIYIYIIDKNPNWRNEIHRMKDEINPKATFYTDNRGYDRSVSIKNIDKKELVSAMIKKLDENN